MLWWPRLVDALANKLKGCGCGPSLNASDCSPHAIARTDESTLSVDLVARNRLSTQAKSSYREAISAADTLAKLRLQRSLGLKSAWSKPPANFLCLPSKTLLHSNQLLSTASFYFIPFIDFAFHKSRQPTKSRRHLSQLNFKASLPNL